MQDRNVRLIFTTHARKIRMPERNITDSDVRTVLRSCTVTDKRFSHPGEVLSAEGKDLDGRNLRICVRINPPCTLIVVTTIDLDKRS
ncbi:DUF4258 domain-containing protein [Caenispirillum salinarum]|uniref:DUF4258 domain-containing protein n=1 Tax=Caenispirillum salinarum TaxID=859058 RepID=UPI0009FE597B